MSGQSRYIKVVNLGPFISNRDLYIKNTLRTFYQHQNPLTPHGIPPFPTDTCILEKMANWSLPPPLSWGKIDSPQPIKSPKHKICSLHFTGKELRNGYCLSVARSSSQDKPPSKIDAKKVDPYNIRAKE